MLPLFYFQLSRARIGSDGIPLLRGEPPACCLGRCGTRIVNVAFVVLGAVLAVVLDRQKKPFRNWRCAPFKLKVHPPLLWLRQSTSSCPPHDFCY